MLAGFGAAFFTVRERPDIRALKIRLFGAVNRSIRRIGAAADAPARVVARFLAQPLGANEAIFTAAMLSLYAISIATNVAAQSSTADPARGTDPKDRRPSEFSPQGLRGGSFTFLPKFEINETYQTNVFATKEDTKDDFVTVLSPGLAVNSDFGRHALNFNAGMDLGSYIDNRDENYVDLQIGTDGRFDIIEELSMSASASFARGHGSRGDPDVATSVEPGITRNITTNVGFNYEVARVSLNGSWNRTFQDLDDVAQLDGTIVNNDDQDRVDNVLSLRAGYELRPENEIFVSTKLNFTDYVDDFDDAGFNRDSSGGSVVIGSTLEFTDLLEGELGIGYFWRNYDDGRYRPVRGPTLRGKVTWHATLLTSITGSVDRTIVETTSTDSAGFIKTQLKLDVSHELRRNLLLGAVLDYSMDDYQGIDQEDSNYDAKVTARFLINPSVAVEVGANYRKRVSDIDTNDFADTSIFGKITLAY